MICLLIAVAAAPVVVAAGDPAGARDQVRFGIDMAKHGLWREAAYRFERATELDPSYAEAFNDLAVAYEQLGRLDEARTLYEQARALAPDNTTVQRNYELFRELDDRRTRPLRAAAAP
jgi:Flp pilus assembly protein TadD